MKYIRTKDGIYETEKCMIITDAVGKEMLYASGQLFINFNIIKRADTIDELIDEFVFTCEDCNKPQLVIPMNFDYCKKEFNHTEIYGAIWVIDSNGVPTLKPVAKMNDKGELELL